MKARANKQTNSECRFGVRENRLNICFHCDEVGSSGKKGENMRWEESPKLKRIFSFWVQADKVQDRKGDKGMRGFHSKKNCCSGGRSLSGFCWAKNESRQAARTFCTCAGFAGRSN